MNLNKNQYEWVSVIMNTYNENKLYLIQAIEAYLNQEKINVQLIISILENDNNLNFIKKKYPEINLCISTKIEHPGRGVKGIFYQLNKATKFIKHNWFCYASSNDVVMTNKLYRELSLCKTYNKLVCYSNYITTNENLKIIKRNIFPAFDYKTLLKGNFINDCALINTNLLRECLPFDNTFNNCGFWKMWLEIYVKYGDVFCYNRQHAFYYRQDKNSMHRQRLKNKKKMDLYQKTKSRMIFTHLHKYPILETLAKKFRKSLPKKRREFDDYPLVIKKNKINNANINTDLNTNPKIIFDKTINFGKSNNTNFDVEIDENKEIVRKINDIHCTIIPFEKAINFIKEKNTMDIDIDT